MSIWVIDVYADETDKAPIHRALAQGTMEAEALLAASKAYQNDKLVVSVGQTLSEGLLGDEQVRQLW